MNTVRNRSCSHSIFQEDSADGLSYAVSLARKTQAEVVALMLTQKQEADAFWIYWP